MIDMIERLEASKAWEYYKRFDDALAKIVTEMVEIEHVNDGERLAWCRPTGWYVLPERDGDEERIAIRGIDARIVCDESHEDAQLSDRYGYHFRNLRGPVNYYVPSSWLWTDDWHETFKNQRLVRDHALARFDLERLHESHDRMQAELSKIGKLIGETRTKLEGLTNELRSRGLDGGQT